MFLPANPLRAQVNTVLFSTIATGTSTPITNWGVDTAATTFDDVQRTLIFMGTNTVNMVQVAFTMDEPLTNSDISPADKPYLTNEVNLASMTSTNARWIMSSGTGAGVNSVYISGTETVYPNLWAATMEAWQQDFSVFFANRTMLATQPFNEPDYCCWDQGSQANLYSVMGYLQASSDFAGVRMAGGTTLNCDNATSWYDAVASRASIGTTHCISGSVAGYVGFIQTVLANSAMPLNPEIHNLGEAIIGANYGLQGGMYWLTCELTRGSFCTACQGQQLGYAEDWANWTAAAVYRGKGMTNQVQAFSGGSERMGVATSYRFFAQDRDVFYNGDGPRRDYTVNNFGSAENSLKVTKGRTCRRQSTAATSSSTITAAKCWKCLLPTRIGECNSTKAIFVGASNQLWDVYPVSNDMSYYSLTAVHSGPAPTCITTVTLLPGPTEMATRCSNTARAAGATIGIFNTPPMVTAKSAVAGATRFWGFQRRLYRQWRR